MVTKKTAAKSPAPKNVDDPNDYHAVIGEHGISNDMSSSQLRAILAVRTPMLASITLKAYALFGDGLGITELSHEMEKAGNEVVSGDMGQIERMLVNQSMTLNAIFNQLALKAEKTSFLKSMEVYMRLALKAQAQARSTAEALALMKNPQPYIRQANIANGPQQVNNGQNAAAVPHTGDFETVPNKLLNQRQPATLVQTLSHQYQEVK